MTYPRQNTQVIKPQFNSGPLSLDAQIEQAKSAFSCAQKKVRSNVKCKFVSPAAADRMPMLQPRDRLFFDNKPVGLPRNNSAQCRVVSTMIAQMFPVANREPSL